MATTWNPSDKSANITLSNGNLTATNAGTNAWVGVRPTTTKTTGKWYWEVTLGQTTEATGTVVGVIDIAAAFNGDSNIIGGYLTGQGGYKYDYDAGTSAQGSSVANDVIGLAWDIGARTLAVYRNNTLKFTCTSASIGTVADTAVFEAYTLNDACTVNFGGSAFTYTPPSGFSAWDLTALAPRNPLPRQAANRASTY